MAKHISRNHFVDISITLGQKRLFRQMGYNLFAKVAILPKGYYFCAKGEAEGEKSGYCPFMCYSIQRHFNDLNILVSAKGH